MKVEYVKSMLGFGQELHIPAKEFRKIDSEAGARTSLMFIIKSYLHECGCGNRIFTRDLQAADSHIKRDGTIILAAQQNEGSIWCNVYSVTDGSIIPVKTSGDGINFTVNLPQKTPEKKERSRKQE